MKVVRITVDNLKEVVIAEGLTMSEARELQRNRIRIMYINNCYDRYVYAIRK